MRGVVYIGSDGLVERCSYWISDTPAENFTAVSVPENTYYKHTFDFDYNFEGDVVPPEWLTSSPP